MPHFNPLMQKVGFCGEIVSYVSSSQCFGIASPAAQKRTTSRATRRWATSRSAIAPKVSAAKEQGSRWSCCKAGKRHCSGIRLVRFYEFLWGELKLPKRSSHSDSIYYASIAHSVWYIVFHCCVSCASIWLALEPWNLMESPSIT